MKPTQQHKPFATNRSKITPPRILLFKTILALACVFSLATSKRVMAVDQIIVTGGTITGSVIGALQPNETLTVTGSVNFFGASGLGLAQKNLKITSGTDEWAVLNGPGLAPSSQHRFTMGGGNVNTTWTFDRIIITGGDSGGAYSGGGIALTAGSGTATINGDFKVLNNRSAAPNAANSGGGGMNAVAGTYVLTGNVEIANNIVYSSSFNSSGGGGINIGNNNANGVIQLGTAASQAASPKTVSIHDNQAMGNGIDAVRGQGGGIRSASFATFFSNVFITSNTAGGNGGGMYVAKIFNMYGNTTFANNYSSFDGGALYAASDLNATGVFTATSNTARAGGAVYLFHSSSNTTTTFSGGSKFVNNTARTTGGAIHWYSAHDDLLQLNANTGDIIFQGNTANGVANAMFIDPAANKTNTIAVTAGAGKTVAFYDPITTGTNDGTGLLITVSGQGTLLFDTYASPVAANTTVNTGATLRLGNNATLGKDNASGALTLKTGASLSGAGTIKTGTLTLETNTLLEARGGNTLKIDAGSVLAPNALRLAGNGTIDISAPLTATNVTVGVSAAGTPNTAQTLTLTSASPLTLASGGLINIDLFANGTNDLLSLDRLTLAGTGAINLAGSGSGAYKILTAASTDLSTLGLTRLVNGAAPTARVTADLRYANSGHELWVDYTSRNLVTTWTGLNGRTWQSSTNAADANWSDTGATDTTFEFGDSVKFTNTGAGTVIIGDAGVIAADITVDATADYTFAGAGGIKTDPDSSFGITAPLTGKLTKKNTGALNLANTGVNTFANGIDIAGGVLSFTTAGQITTTGTSISFIGTGTLRAAANGITIDNTLDIAPAVSAAIDVQTTELTYTGTLRGGATATLNKTGAGNLVITADESATFTGTTNISGGALTLANTGILGGSIIVQNNAILGGNGIAGAGAAGSVTVRPGGIISVGMPGVLNPQVITLNNLSVNGAQLHYDLFASDASDRINATGAPINVGAATNTIVLTTFQTGTFNLGNIAALDGKVTVSEIGGMSPRHSGTLTVSGNDLILKATGDQSRIVTWTGADNASWDYSANWRESGTALPFASGDSIIFDSTSDTAARRTISLNTAPVRATAITVQGNADYTFTGTNGLTTDATSNILGGIASPTGKLIKQGNGTLTFANTAANNFLGGIEISGGFIAFANDAQLGDGGRGITFTGTGGLTPTASTTLTNNITIKADARATISTGNNSLAYTGSLAAGGTTSALYKSGTGTLTLSGNDNSDYTGLTHVTGGQLALENGAQLGGKVAIMNGSTLSGSGTLGGMVNITANAKLLVGDGATPGALTIGSLSLNDTSSIGGAGSLAVSSASINGLVTANIASSAELTMTGRLAGTGTLNKIGGGNLIFTDTNSFGIFVAIGGDINNPGYYSIVINEGIVMLRGITGVRTGTGAHNIFLNGGWLDLSDTPDTDPVNNWSGFNITGTRGGVIGANDMITLRAGENNLTIGTIEKPGIFVAVAAGEGNTATITGTSAYVGYTRLDSGILKVTADSQLGDLTANRNVVFNGGNLQVSATFATARTLELRASGTLITDANITTAWAAISGTNTATLTKTGDGTLVNNGNSTIKGVNVQAGRLIALKANGLGAASGTSTVAEGAVIEFRNISGVIAADTNIVGSGTLLLTSNTFTMSGNNAVKNIVLENSTVTVASKNALGTAASSIIMDPRSRLTITATTSEFGSIALNGGMLAFSNPTAGNYRRSTIEKLEGGGMLRMNVNFVGASGLALAGTKADYLVINSGSGTYTLNISTTARGSRNPLSSFDLIDSGTSNVTFELFNGTYEYGTNRYHLAKGYGDPYAPDPTHWYLVYNTISNTAEAILNTAATANIDWFVTMDSVTQRLGDNRNNLSDARDHYQSPDSFKSPAIGDTWIRAHGYQLDATNQYSGRNFTQYTGGISAGMDRAFKTANTATLLGVFVDTGLISRNFKEHGSGHTYTLTAGLYSTWMHAKGWYADLALAGSTYGNRFTSQTASAGPIEGRYQNTILGGTLELGRRSEFKNGWWSELALQGGAANINGSTYDTSADNVGVKSNVSIAEQNARQYRVLLRIGRQRENSRWNPYFKAALVAADSYGGEILVDDRFLATDYNGGRFEAGFGTTYNFGKLSQLYFDYEYAKASDYERPWTLNLGVRYLW